MTGRVLRDLQSDLWALLLYNAIFAALSLFVFTPLLSWAVSFMTASSGRP